MKDDKILEEAKKRYEEAEEGWSENHEAALDDIKFARLGEQWPEGIKEKRETEGRPCLTINRLPTFIRQVVNDARLNSPSIKVHPVDDFADVETAEVLNGIIRNIEQTSGADVAYDNALENAVTSGCGYFRIDIQYAHNDAFEMDLTIERIANPLSVFSDPYSMAVDASDWTYCFLIENMSQEQFKSAYPNAELSDWEGDDSQGWVGEDSVRVAEYWDRKEIDVELLLLSTGEVINKDQYIENQHVFDAAGSTIADTRQSKSYKVTHYVMTGQEILETEEWPGTLIPIIPCYGDEIVVEEKRHFHSLIRQAKDSQQNFNYWRTAATEKVALATKAPWIGPARFAETDQAKWETANSENHAYLEYDGPIPPQQTPPSMVDAGSITEAMNASDDLKNIMGLQDASLGIAGNEVSGRAINARQREGDMSTFHFVDNLSRAMTYGGQVLLELIPHVYNKPRIMRIMGFDGEPDSVQVNEEFDLNGMTKLHDLTKGKYDLVVSTGPSFMSQRDEAATQMTELLRSFPDAAPIIGDLVAKSLDWPGADEIAKRLKTLLPPEIQAMEKMDGLPPEAQAAVAQAQKQTKQMGDMIEQGKQLLMQKDEEIKMLEMDKRSKQGELMVKDTDSKRRYDADMAKIQADMATSEAKENETNRRLIITETIDTLKQHMQETTQPQFDSMNEHIESMNAIAQSVEAQGEVLRKLAEYVESQNNQTKSIEVQAPSGETYAGIVEDGEIKIKAPSGAIYSGSVTEH